jgi:protein-L-isoaspartate(D-aspartate) O-methyltransferase
MANVGGMMTNLEVSKSVMINDHLMARGVTNDRVLAAMRRVPRENFVAAELRDRAYDDNPLPIAEGQTISQPFIVAYMAEALELAPRDTVLEIGTGSGYAAAVLSLIAGEVYSVERVPALANGAAELLARLGYGNVHIREGDGTLGWPDFAPYDAIMVSAGAPEIPQLLLDQLAVGGRLVIPVGSGQFSQALVRVRRTSENEFYRQYLTEVRFVPLIGEFGWEA